MLKQTQKNYNVGIYCRLSRDDGNGESASIGSQKLMLADYVNSQGWRITDYYCDDGVSGVTFDRPELNRLIDDIEMDKVNLVICKDAYVKYGLKFFEIFLSFLLPFRMPNNTQGIVLRRTIPYFHFMNVRYRLFVVDNVDNKRGGSALRVELISAYFHS